MMKFGIRTPSFKKSLAARTSVKRYVQHSLGFKAPRGWGWVINPRKAAYNRVYNRTTLSVGRGSGFEALLVGVLIYLLFGVIILAFKLAAWIFSEITAWIRSSSTTKPAPELSGSSAEAQGETIGYQQGPQQSQHTPLCPRCNGPMVQRTAKRGSNAGRSFWGCSRFPHCRGTKNV